MNFPGALRVVAAAAFTLLATHVPAATGAYVYTLNPFGKLSVNGTVLEELPGEFSEDDDYFYNRDDAWVALEVVGADRYTLRADGIVRFNGKKLYALPWVLGQRWAAMAVEGANVFCLRADGLLALDGQRIAELPSDGFFFRRILVRNGRAFSLRADGALFRDGGSRPYGRFVAGPGPESGDEEGIGPDSKWVTLGSSPVLPLLYALRSDGKVHFLAPDLEDMPILLGEEAAALPFFYDTDTDMDGEADDYPYLDDIYVDMEVASDGTWFALAGDGRVYSADGGLVPVEDFPGTAAQTQSSFADLALMNGCLWALRNDARVYLGGPAPEVLEFFGESYGRLAVSASPPDLGDIDDHEPKCIAFETKTVVGTALDLPVVATDIETRSADLVVTPVSIPVDGTGSAATWDGAARVLHWDAPAEAGTFKFKFQVSDGMATKNFAFTIKVLEPDLDPVKNKPPPLPAFKGSRPVVGQPFSFPFVVDDRDGDPLQVTVDPEDYPFNAGATFDPATRVFSWTPAYEDHGDRKVRFQVFDGTVLKEKTVTLKVRNGLIF